MISYVLAQQANAEFFLRVEDTDTVRSTKEFEVDILNSLAWLGIKHSGTIIRQAEQEASGLYKDVAKKLVEAGLAYYCGCTRISLQKMKMAQIQEKLPLGYTGVCRDSGHESGALRLNMAKIRLALDTQGEYGGLRHLKFTDNVFGSRNNDLRDLNDIVLLRANGEATYLMANTIDDLFSGVNNIVRGADILPQTIIQIVLRTVIARVSHLPEDIPIYTHVPLVLGENKEKLSKRSPTTKSVLEMKAEGLLPDAIIQFALAIGNNSVPKEEALSLDEIVKIYDASKNAKNNVAFSVHQLLFINKLHIRRTSEDELNTLMGTDFTPEVLKVCKFRVNNLVSLKEDAENVNLILSNFATELKELKATGISGETCKKFRDAHLNGASGVALDVLATL